MSKKFTQSEYQLYCDNCGRGLMYVGLSERQCDRYSRMHGWGVGKLTLCPECKNQKKKE